MARQKLTTCLLFLSVALASREAYAGWAKTFGGGGDEEARSVLQTSDSGYVLAGWTTSFGMGGRDFLVVKLTAFGGVLWGKSFGGTGWDMAYAVRQTYDPKYGSGYIVVGETNSFGAGNYDGLLLKLDDAGTLQWAKTVGGSTWDNFYAGIQASDGSYVLAGRTASYGAGAGDVLVAKIGPGGASTWTRVYGGTSYEEARDIRETSDNGYVVAGWTDSYGSGRKDFLILKLNSSGTLQWTKTYGGVNSDEACSIQQTSDNGYIVAGKSWTSASGSEDFLILKLSPNGDYQWQKTYGNSGDDEAAYSVQQTSDGGYVVAGTRYGIYAHDFYYLKLTAAGAKQWEYVVTPNSTQTPGEELAYCVQQTSDGGYAIGGGGYYEFFLTRLDATGTIPGCPRIWDVALPNPYLNLGTSTISPASAAPSISVLSPAVATAEVAITEYTVCSGGGGGGCGAAPAQASAVDGQPPVSQTPLNLFAGFVLILGGLVLAAHVRNCLTGGARNSVR